MRGASTPVGEWRYAAYSPAAAEYAHWRERSQYVGQLELLAAVAVYYSLAAELRGREVIHFIDNAGAMACLVKGSSAELDSSLLVHTFWALAAALDIDVWFEFVYSEANIADWPSRGDIAFMRDLSPEFDPESDLVRVEVPSVTSWGDVDPLVASVPSAAPPPRKKRRRR